MIIFNYNKFFKKYGELIEYYAKKTSKYDIEDNKQEINIYIFENLNRFDIEKSYLDFYVYLLVLTRYRKFISDKKRQLSFEEGFLPFDCESWTLLCGSTKIIVDDYDQFISKIVLNLKNIKQIVIFYTILYNSDKSYSELAKMINMNYYAFLAHVRNIKKILRTIC